MHIPELIPSIPSSLSEQLRRQTNALCSKIIKTNYNTQFGQTAPELAELRQATAGRVDQMDDDDLSEKFHNTVHLTTYDAYAPFTAPSFSSGGSCKASAVVDLLAPGLPDFVLDSSSTSGGLAKLFPKYNILSKMASAHAEPMTDSSRRRTAAFIWYLGCRRMTVLGDDDRAAATIYMSSGSVMDKRTRLRLHPEDDENRMGTFVLDHAAPYAAGFIRRWSSFLLIHVLFAVSSRSLETMNMLFLHAFVDMMHHLDTNFDMIVDCIASGTIPDLEGLAEVRHYLEMNISADPERAAELRRLGCPSSREGWCMYVWPNLRFVTTTASGPFGSCAPLVRRFLGPNTEILSHGYGSSEGWIGAPYNPFELSQFKLDDKTVFELLDIDKEDSIAALSQVWKVEPGRRYELVMTTQDGLWRYRLGDVVEVCGFDPRDGMPVIRFVERRTSGIRFYSFVVTEKDLRASMSCIPPNRIVNWTAAADNRRFPFTIGFFVELVGDQDAYGAEPHAHSLLRERVLDELLRIENLATDFGLGKFGKPTIRLVRAGTFSAFLQLKLDEGSRNVGQIKVPVALPKAEYVTWFSDQVVCEL